LAAYLVTLARDEGVTITSRVLARFEPVEFDAAMVQRIEAVTRRLGFSQRRMTSGAGHDAQMLARVCPAAMIFVPSIKGISHHPQAVDLCAGANVLWQTLVELANDKEK